MQIGFNLAKAESIKSMPSGLYRAKIVDEGKPKKSKNNEDMCMLRFKLEEPAEVIERMQCSLHFENLMINQDNASRWQKLYLAAGFSMEDLNSEDGVNTSMLAGKTVIIELCAVWNEESNRWFSNITNYYRDDPDAELSVDEESLETLHQAWKDSEEVPTLPNTNKAGTSSLSDAELGI